MASYHVRNYLAVCLWYLLPPLSYRHLEEMMLERGLTGDHTTVYRWVQAYAPSLDKRGLCCQNNLRTDDPPQSPLPMPPLQKFETRILLVPECLLWQHLELVPCGSCSSLHILSRFASRSLNEAPIPGLTNRLMNRWSSSTMLLRYKTCRSSVVSPRVWS